MCTTPRLRCSTPFGIRGRNARPMSMILAPILEVLNAFRHQRKKRLQKGDITSPQRPCAQRLSASEEETLVALRHQWRPNQVLNAFRHQRKKRGLAPNRTAKIQACSTPFGIRGRNAQANQPDPDPQPDVLNAFRHQRKKRHPDAAKRRGCREVLNAFRHQRKKRCLAVLRTGRPG